MGVKCCITLPGRVRVHDVATVVGACLGFRKQKFRSGSSWWTSVPEVSIKNYGDPGLVECCRIVFPSAHGASDWLMYHFEWEDETGCGRGLLPRSTARNIALAHRLVDFFGGSITHQDSNSGIDYCRPWKPIHKIAPTRGKAWQDFQERLFAVQPITDEETEQYKQYAAY